MLLKPNKAFDKLPKEERKVLLYCIRKYLKGCQELTSTLGLEKTEEAFINLYNKGFIQYAYDNKQEVNFYLYDIEDSKYYMMEK